MGHKWRQGEGNAVSGDREGRVRGVAGTSHSIVTAVRVTCLAVISLRSVRLTCDPVQYLLDELRVEVVGQPSVYVLDIVLKGGNLEGNRRTKRDKKKREIE